MKDYRPSRAGVVRGLLFSVALHAPAAAWVGVRLFERADLASVTVYEIEVLPEPPWPVEKSELREQPRPPPVVARSEDVPLPSEHQVAEPAPGTAATAPLAPGVRRPVGVPAAAKAGRVLTAPEEGGEPDALDFTIVQGKASRYAGGVTAATGTSDRAVRDPKARGGAAPARRPGGKGTGAGTQPPPRAAPTAELPSKKRSARPVSVSWNCPFPAEADAHDVHYARVLIVVSVRKNGSAAQAAVLSDPGFGFGSAARRCALGQRYAVAWDDHGRPTAGRTPPFTVTFTR